MAHQLIGVTREEFETMPYRTLITVRCGCGLNAERYVGAIKRIEKAREEWRCRSCGISKAHRTYYKTSEGKEFLKRLGKSGNAASEYKTTSEVAKKIWETRRRNGTASVDCDRKRSAFGRGVLQYYITHPVTEKVVRVQGTYELMYACHLIASEVDFDTHPKSLPYFDDNGIQRHYHPDFYIREFDLYVEIKSDYTLSIPGAKEKYDAIKALGHNLLVLSNSQLEKLGVLCRKNS